MPSKLTPKWRALWYLAICAPMLALPLECLRGAYCDLIMIRTAALRAEMGRLRSQAMRRAGNLDALLKRHAGPLDWKAVRDDSGIAEFWKRLAKAEHPPLYSAVLDRSRTVVMHSDSDLLNSHFQHGWYDRKMTEVGDDVVHFVDGGLAKVPAYDLSIPLFVDGQQIGDYHEGLDANAFESSIWPQQRDVLLRWGLAFAGVVAIDGIAIWSLIFVTRRNQQLFYLVQRGIQAQHRILAQIGGGLAHQIRNPLHTLRINLHILKRVQNGQAQLGGEQIESAYRECNAEIDELDRLMRDLLQFAVPHSGAPANVEIAPAVHAALNLLDEEFRRKQIEVKAELSAEPMAVLMDPNHLRQAVGNLLMFAHLNTPNKGQVEVTLTPHGRSADLTVEHNGPSLTSQQQQQIFEPFQTEHESGSGLELALVQCVVMDAGGKVTCERRVPSGNCFRVSLPLAQSRTEESNS